MNANQLVAHRGYQQRYPENTLVAIAKALMLGARWIECDIQLSADAVPLLLHDDNTERMCGVDGSVFSMTARALTQLPAGEVSRLGEVFDDCYINCLVDLVPVIKRYPKVHFLLELKEESIHFHGLDICLQAISTAMAPVLSQCILISFDAEAVKSARDYGFSQTAIVFRNWALRDTILNDTRADYGMINYQRIDCLAQHDESIKAARPIIVYELCDPVLAKQLLGRGVFAVETFCIQHMLAACDDDLP